MNRFHRLWPLAFLVLCGPPPAQAVLTIKITKGVEGALPIAVVPFGGNPGPALPVDMARVIAADLESSGRFEPMARADMPGRPVEPGAVGFADWRRLGMENLVIGRIGPGTVAEHEVQFWLMDVYKGSQIISYRFKADTAKLRLVSHQIADLIFQALTGTRGAFATRIAYVAVSRARAGKKVYQLEVADADGENPHTLLTSSQPLMSPAWSPDGRRLAYVSFEGFGSAIYLQELQSAGREPLATEPGINSAPAFSPDGRRLALTLSKDGNPEVYIMDLGSRALRRMTHDPGIDTEPAWSPDGNRIAFTSDRGGGPQIYEMSASGGTPRRLTHEGDYNARPRYSADAKLLALVHGDGRGYHIATLDLAAERLNVLTETRLDESPSFAPNGGMIIVSRLIDASGIDGIGPARARE
ncbi:MAG: Tol-Pal system beta propeller repeat protein TolB [Beggiatoa sp.]|nr:Tol-Pal system beta propeller repeat protein TolB [Beggiatoa sp.]